MTRDPETIQKAVDTLEEEDAVEELLRDLAHYLYRQLRDQSDYLHSDEAVDESIEANGYEFTEDGSIA